MNQDNTAVLMLPGFLLLESEVVNNELVLTVQTPRYPVGCSASGSVYRNRRLATRVLCGSTD